ncbi:MAG TPA: hypothetical protein VIR55_11100 [Ignavibacteria bacterium]
MKTTKLFFITSIMLITIIVISCNKKEGEENLSNQNNNNISQSVDNNLPAKKSETSDTITNNQMNKSDNSQKSNLDFLNKYKGKYLGQENLLDNPVLKERLKKMLGSRFDFIYLIWETETPIEINNGILYAWAMQAHSGGDPEVVLMADLNKNVLYVGIRENGKVELYSEDGSEVPQRMSEWAN